MRYLVLLSFFIALGLQAQVLEPNDSIRDDEPNEPLTRVNKDSIFNRQGSQEVGEKIFKPTIFDYQYFTDVELEKVPFDTALTIESFYNQNWTQKDWFGKMPFPNIGRPLNPLQFAERQENLSILPEGKTPYYIGADEVRYYDVKTPMNEFVYENGVRDGQSLSTTFTHNVNRQFNYSFRYRGIRSQGRFLREISSNNVLIFGANYKSKNDRVKVRAHYASHNIDNEENGGIDSLELFTEPGEDIVGTDNLDVNLTNTETRFDARRFRLVTSLGILKKTTEADSTVYQPIQLENNFTYEKQKYLYDENSTESFFDPISGVFSGIQRQNLKSSENLRNTTTLGFKWKDKFNIKAGLLYQNVQVYGDSAFVRGLVNIPEGINDNLIGAVAKLSFDWNDRINIVANGEYSRGDFFGNQFELNGDLQVNPIKDISLGASLLLNSKYPSLNLVFNQSFYENFNFFNQRFSNENTQKLVGRISSERFRTNIEAGITRIENYVYVDPSLRPRQLDNDLSIFEVKVQNRLKYKKFNLQTTLLYQEVTQNEAFLPLPQFVGRASIWWQSYAFNKAAEVQVGLNVNYFTGFQSRVFNPLLNEFVLQEQNEATQEIGDFPIIDIFLNLKVKRMRIYIRGDHINQLISDQRNYFSAPNVPFREWKMQIGIKWYLFT